MFVLRNIVNHELYTSDIEFDGEFMHGVEGCERKQDLEQEKNGAILEKVGKYYIDDWKIIELDDKLYIEINHLLNNDSDLKTFYYDSGVFEILNTATGKLSRYEKEE